MFKKMVLGLILIGGLGSGGYYLYRWNQERIAERSRPVRFDQKYDSALKELKIEDLKMGSGQAAARGKKVTVHYVSRLPDGTVFDSSRTRKQPVSFPLGVAQALPAWDHGLIGMRVGGVRKIKSPPFLAYGEAGVGQAVPPNSPVEFEFELLKVGEADDALTLRNRAAEKAAMAAAEKTAHSASAASPAHSAPPVKAAAAPKSKSSKKAVAKPTPQPDRKPNSVHPSRSKKKKIQGKQR